MFSFIYLFIFHLFEMLRVFDFKVLMIRDRLEKLIYTYKFNYKYDLNQDALLNQRIVSIEHLVALIADMLINVI